MADTSRHHPMGRRIYDRVRARGASHQHDIRILGQPGAACYERIWQDGDVHDPTRRGALRRLITHEG